MKHLWQKNEAIHSTVFHTIQISRSSGFSSPFQVEKSWPLFDDISKHTVTLHSTVHLIKICGLSQKRAFIKAHHNIP